VQTALPGDPDATASRGGKAPTTPSLAPKKPARSPQNPANRFRSSSSSGSGNLAKVLSWGLVLVVILLLLAAVVNAIVERRRRQTTPAAQKAARPGPTNEGTAPPPLHDYEHLANEGRYAEAVHALLQHAFVKLARRRAMSWPAAQTGREILAAVGGFEAGDAPLRAVFRTSEAAWFGELAVDREQYERCLSNFRGWSAE
jgi:hypothetical protein